MMYDSRKYETECRCGETVQTAEKSWGRNFLCRRCRSSDRGLNEALESKQQLTMLNWMGQS